MRHVHHATHLGMHRCDAPCDAPCNAPCKVVAPDAVPRELSQAAQGLLVRCLAGGYRGTADAFRQSASTPVLLLHVRVESGADGSLLDLPCEFNGFLWVLAGAVVVGGSGEAGGERQGVRAEHGVQRGLVMLPPGGDTLRIRHAGAVDGGGEARREAGASDAAQLFIGLGRPHRKPHVKYVGYGGGFIHRSVEEVEAHVE